MTLLQPGSQYPQQQKRFTFLLAITEIKLEMLSTFTSQTGPPNFQAKTKPYNQSKTKTHNYAVVVYIMVSPLNLSNTISMANIKQKC